MHNHSSSNGTNLREHCCSLLLVPLLLLSKPLLNLSQMLPTMKSCALCTKGVHIVLR
jgi:hypothetical protein